MNILYIANRGEIARRIIRSARKLGFKTAVGYANQDRELPFVAEADVALPLGGEESNETYLSIPKVLALAQKVHATHLHPGYGFLSENPKFVDAVEREAIHFVGPSSESMRLLGDKIGSRIFLKKLGISLLPSYDGEDQSDSHLFDEAVKLGFPLLIKPSAGGGGKGMLRVDRKEDFAASLLSSKRVAAAAFGDVRVFLERYIERSRHIEVQIVGDREGVVHILGERECSLQKRHQKVIEEAPCVFLPPEVRAQIYESSARIAREAKYHSLGTVEWIWDGGAGIYFLEVNARLQVEHPVTELVWNTDLVELQLAVALGRSLKGHHFAPKGHSIEARICAEDPDKDFLPSGGKIHRLRLPKSVRADFGYCERNLIPSQFDSLMGKIISYGKDRAEASQELASALQQLVIFGPATNRAYLLQLLECDEFKSGGLSTDLISKTPYLFNWNKGFDLLAPEPQGRSTDSEDDDADLFSPWGPSPQVNEGGGSGKYFFEDVGERRYFHSAFADWSTVRPRAEGGASEHHHESETLEVRSPMPGRVIKVMARVGDSVKKGGVLLILEAMKMEHQIKASKDGEVAEVSVREGDRVSMDALLLKWSVR